MRTLNLQANAHRARRKFRPNAQADGQLPPAMKLDKKAGDEAKEKAAVARRQLVSRAVIDRAFHKVRPASPLPVALLDGVRLHGDLTATDAAALDIMLACVREEPNVPERRLPSAALADALKLSRRERLADTLRRLGKASISFDVQHRNFREIADSVALVTITHIEKDDGERGISFSFASQVLRLLHGGLPYAHVELSALAQFRSKWSARIYGRILRRIRDENVGPTGGRIEFSENPHELAEALGWDMGGFAFADFRRNALEPALKDFRKFGRLDVTLDMRRSAARGRPVESLDFTVDIHPSAPGAVRTEFLEKGACEELADSYRSEDKRLAVRPRTILKAIKLFDADTFAPLAELEEEAGDLRGSVLSKSWELALHRALEGVEDEVEGRAYRGRALLAAIESDGAEDTAWQFFVEEARSPDLVQNIAALKVGAEGGEAWLARRERAKADRAGNPIDLTPAAKAEPDQPEPDSTPDEVTIVLADGTTFNAFSDVIDPHRVPSSEEGGVRMWWAARNARGRYSVHDSIYRLHPESLSEIPNLEGVAEILQCDKSEAQAILSARDDADPHPSKSELSLVLSDMRVANGLSDVLRPWQAQHDEYGLDVAIAFEDRGQWKVIDRVDLSIKARSEAEISKLAEIGEVLPYGSKAAKVILDRRPAAAA